MKIVLPGNVAGQPAKGWGTRCYTDDGSEIKGITGMRIDIVPDDIITATVTVCVAAIENIDAHPLLAFETVKEAAERYGYKLVRNQA